MPMVRTYTGDRVKGSNAIWGLMHVCREIIPAAMTCDEVMLTPGSIEFYNQQAVYGCGEYGQDVDVVIDIEASSTPSRSANRDERATSIMDALHELAPQTTFAVHLKLVDACWLSDANDPDFDGDMSMEAAIERVREITANVSGSRLP
jgi:hypothetical protein